MFVIFGSDALRLIANISATATIGLFLCAVVAHGLDSLTPGSRRRILLAASTVATVWMVSAALRIVFTYAEFVPLPIQDAFNPEDLLAFIDAIEQAKALLVQTFVASILAALGFRARSTLSVAALLGVSLLGLLPGPLTGHAASQSSHTLAVSMLSLHVLAACLWVGSIIALIVVASRNELSHVDGLTFSRRISGLALWCFFSIAVSGVISGIIRVPDFNSLFSTKYGILLVLKSLGMIGLGALAIRQRNNLRRGASSKTLYRLAGYELLVLAAVMAIAGVLATSATPTTGVLPVQTPASTILGFDLPSVPTISDWLFAVQPDGFVLIAAVFAILAYVAASRRLARTGRKWPRKRTASWIAGWLLITYVTSGGIGVYSGALFSAHMMQHMTVGMLAPILLVLAEPIALFLRALPPSPSKNVKGPREWLTSAIRSRAANVITNPLVAAGLFAGSLWILYFTPLFETLMSSHYGHLLMSAHFVLVGFLFFYVLIGKDVSSTRFPYPARLGLLFITMVSHAFFGLVLMSTTGVLARSYYESLSLSWGPDLLSDQRAGAAFAWAIGEVPLTAVLMVLFFRWAKAEERAAAQEDSVDLYQVS